MLRGGRPRTVSNCNGVNCCAVTGKLNQVSTARAGQTNSWQSLLSAKGSITWRAEILLRLHGYFQPGVKFKIAVKSGRPPSCFAENAITEHAQAHFSALAEILMRLHEVFLSFSPGWKSQPGFPNRAGNLSPGWDSLHVIANVFLRRFVQEAEVKSQPG